MYKIGYVQKELKVALEIFEEYPAATPNPVRLDDCKVSDTRLKELNCVDLFLTCREGFKKILKTIEIAIYNGCFTRLSFTKCAKSDE